MVRFSVSLGAVSWQPIVRHRAVAYWQCISASPTLIIQIQTHGLNLGDPTGSQIRHLLFEMHYL